MLFAHLASGLLLAVVAALWGWSASYSTLSCLGLYSLGGNAGVLGSAAVVVLSGRGSTASR
jgi:hypothetical protein